MAVHGARDGDQLCRADLHRVSEGGQAEQFTVQSQPAERGGDGLGVGGGGRDDARPAQLLQFGGRPSPNTALSVCSATIERMFESMELSTTTESAALLEQACAAARTEAQATARRLNVIADLMQLRDRQYGDRAEWVADLWDAIAAELAAALRVSRALASSYMSDAEVMRERLPKVGDCLAAGDINYAMFQVIAYRTALITDKKSLAAVDAQVAMRAPRWPSLTRGNLAMRVDAIVAKVDRDAIRRTNKEVKDRYLNVSESVPGIAEVYGNVFASTGRALDRPVESCQDARKV